MRHPARFQKSILSIGRFAKNKRIDLLIDFVQALRRHDPEWKLTIAGRPGDLTVEDVSALVDRAGLRGAVNIVASPTDATVKALMRNCSFLASSSDYEGFGVAAIEGMSAGLIPLLSDIPPFRRLVARTGLGMIIDYSAPDIAARSLLQNLERIASGLCGATRGVHACSRILRLAACLPGLRQALRCVPPGQR